MYIGGTDEKAFHHLFAEVIDNSMDEAVAGHATFIEVELEEGGFLSVTDNGRGIPVDPHPKFPKKSALEVIMTTLHAGGKFDSKVYETSGGLHGVGVSVVNALSEMLEVEVARGQTLYRQVFSRGLPQTKLETVGRVLNRRGTKVRFKPDHQIFGKDAHFQPRRLFKMARSKAYLFGGVEIRWKCAPSLLAGIDSVPAEATFKFPNGLKDYLAHDIEGKELVSDQIFSGKITKPGGHGSLEWAVAWMAHEDGFSSSYCNTVPTPDGGTHENGLRIALLRGLRDHAERVGQTEAHGAGHHRRRDVDLRLDAVGVHPRAGIPGADQGQAGDAGGGPHRRKRHPRHLRSLARRLPAPGQQDPRMGHGPGRRAAAATAGKGSRPQDRDPQAAPSRQARRLLQCGRGRLRTVHRRGRFGRRLGQAGARPQDARRSCRLRGKILNVASAGRDKLHQNQQLSDLVQALGCGMGTAYRDADLRYERVVIMTDADVDGAHIASLLITFFYRQMPRLIDAGHLYLAVPPLYRLTQGAKTVYARDDADKDRLMKIGLQRQRQDRDRAVQGPGRDAAGAAQGDHHGPEEAHAPEGRDRRRRAAGNERCRRAPDGQQARGALPVHPGTGGLRQRGSAGYLRRLSSPCGAREAGVPGSQNYF